MNVPREIMNPYKKSCQCSQLLQKYLKMSKEVLDSDSDVRKLHK